MSCSSEKLLAEQTEFEFFQELTSSPQTITCAGAIIPIGFTPYSIEQLKAAFAYLNCQPEYVEVYTAETLKSGSKVIRMCVKHWLLHGRAIGMAGDIIVDDDWVALAENILGVICLANKWDYRELINYYATATNLLEE